MMFIWLIFAFRYDRIALPPQKFTNLTKCILKLPFLEIGLQSVQDPDPREKINKWGEHCQPLAFCLVHLLDHSTWGSIPNRNSSITEKETNLKHSFCGQSSRERQLCQERALRSCTGPPMSFYSSGSGWKLSCVFETNLPQDHLEGVFQMSNQRMPRAETRLISDETRLSKLVEQP